MNKQTESLLQIHIAVFLFGISGLFAKFLLLPAPVIVFGRVLFSSLFLYIIMKVRRQKFSLSDKRHYFIMLISGAVLALHWVSFLQSIQVSTVAIGTLTFSTFPIFVTFAEPLLFKEKLKLSAVLTSIAMFCGMLFIIPEFKLGNDITIGVIWGLISAITYAALSLINRGFTKIYSGMHIAFYEQFFAAVILLPVLFVYKPIFTAADVGLLVLLGTVFTATAHSLFINGIKNVKVQTAGIISALESIYGIIAAALFLKEIPGFREIVGGTIILSVVFYSTISSGKKQ